jgi:predicted nucleotide-binding protein
MFVSYAKQDAEHVLPVVDAVTTEYRLRGLPVEVWIDFTHLTPGEHWDLEIERALKDSIGMLVFVSPAAIASDWVGRELMSALTHQDRLIIPVILRHVPNLPPALKQRQWLDLSSSPHLTRADILRAAKLIADATEEKLNAPGAAPTPPVTAAAAPAIAATIAEEARGAHKAAASTVGPPDSVFVVHGHDQSALSEMEKYLTSVGVTPIILSKLGGAEQSLLQKFLKTASASRFAIVILSADDMGASRVQYDAPDVGVHALRFRARQNVILELGFFYGLLGWENVFVLRKPPEKVYPDFERPSDIEGAVFESMDATGNWHTSLAGKLNEAGFLLKKKVAKKSARKKAATAKSAGAVIHSRTGAKKVTGVVAKRKLKALLAYSKYPNGRSLKTLCLKTGLSEEGCRKLLREIGARKVKLNVGEGWTLRP